MGEKGRRTTKKKQHEGTQKIRCTLALRRSAMVPARKHTCPTYWMMHPEAKANLSERRSWNRTDGLPEGTWFLLEASIFLENTSPWRYKMCSICVGQDLHGSIVPSHMDPCLLSKRLREICLCLSSSLSVMLQKFSYIYVDVLHLILRWFHLHHLYLINFDYICLCGMWFLWRFPKSCYPSHPSHCQIPKSTPLRSPSRFFRVLPCFPRA